MYYIYYTYIYVYCHLLFTSICKFALRLNRGEDDIIASVCIIMILSPLLYSES